jgi:hypothetical protein
VAKYLYYKLGNQFGIRAALQAMYDEAITDDSRRVDAAVFLGNEGTYSMLLLRADTSWFSLCINIDGDDRHESTHEEIHIDLGGTSFSEWLDNNPDFVHKLAQVIASDMYWQHVRKEASSKYTELFEEYTQWRNCV